MATHVPENLMLVGTASKLHQVIKVQMNNIVLKESDRLLPRQAITEHDEPLLSPDIDHKRGFRAPQVLGAS